MLVFCLFSESEGVESRTTSDGGFGRSQNLAEVQVLDLDESDLG